MGVALSTTVLGIGCKQTLIVSIATKSHIAILTTTDKFQTYFAIMTTVDKSKTCIVWQSFYAYKFYMFTGLEEAWEIRHSCSTESPVKLIAVQLCTVTTHESRMEQSNINISSTLHRSCHIKTQILLCFLDSTLIL